MTKKKTTEELMVIVKQQRKQLLKAKRLLDQAAYCIPDYMDGRNDKLVDKIYKFLDEN